MLKSVEHLPCEERLNEPETIILWKQWLTGVYKRISVIEYKYSSFLIQELLGIKSRQQVLGSKGAKGDAPQNAELCSKTAYPRTCWMLRVYMTSKRKLRGKIMEGKSTRSYCCGSGHPWTAGCWRLKDSSNKVMLPTFPGFVLSPQHLPSASAEDEVWDWCSIGSHPVQPILHRAEFKPPPGAVRVMSATISQGSPLIDKNIPRCTY